MHHTKSFIEIRTLYLGFEDLKIENLKVNIRIVFQNTKNIEGRAIIPKDRVKPFGTAHAILCAKDVIKEPFVIINADDFYGNDAFKAISEYIDNNNKNELGLVGYNVINTLTENGSVKRGICETENGKLVRIIESSIVENNGQIEATPLDSDETKIIDKNTKVSMNMNSYYPEFFDYIDEKMDDFLKTANLEKDEYLIPEVMTQAIKEGLTCVNVIETNAKWVGITYKEDKPSVVKYIQEQINKELYPNDLWK